MKTLYPALVTALIAIPAAGHADEIPASIAASGETHIVTVQAQGAQVYECKADAAGKLAWSFREPIATLLLDGKTVGRHYAGPNWEWADGSIVAGKVIGRAPGASANDIPLLKLAAGQHRGAGMLDGVATIQRLATKGGMPEAPCAVAGTILSVAYSADYAFHRKTYSARQN